MITNILNFKGKQFSIGEDPLKSWIKYQQIKLSNASGSIEEMNNNARLSISLNFVGYVANWEIRENKLYLNQLTNSKVIEELLEHTFPVLAEWYSGDILIGIGNTNNAEYPRVSKVRYEYEFILTISQGIVIKKQLVTNFIEDQIFQSGKYEGLPVMDVFLGLLNRKKHNPITNYIADLVKLFVLHEFDYNVIVPTYTNVEVENLNKSDLNKNGIGYFEGYDIKFIVAANYIAVNRELFEDDHISNKLSGILEHIMQASFEQTMEFAKKRFAGYPISPNSTINPDIEYIVWAIKNEYYFAIPPDQLNKTYKLKKLKSFQIKRLNDTVFEFRPEILEFEYTMPKELQKINAAKFIRKNHLEYDKRLNGYVFTDQKFIPLDFAFFINDSITCQADLEKYHMEIAKQINKAKAKYGSDNYGYKSGRYGGYNDFSDDVIDDAFEGDPYNTWNVD